VPLYWKRSSQRGSKGGHKDQKSSSSSSSSTTLGDLINWKRSEREGDGE